MLAGGVDQSHVRWVPYDGVGRTVRNGLNFTERGFGVRGAVGVSDRGHTAVSQLRPGEIDWEAIFAAEGARWFHTGGIFAALSATDGRCRRRGDDRRPPARRDRQLRLELPAQPVAGHRWQGTRANEVNRSLAPLVDVMFGNEEDFSACLGFEAPGVGQICRASTRTATAR